MTRSGVAVFGAGGPVGRAILDVLRTDPRISVIACLRRPPAEDPAVPWRLADARDERAVARALDGCGFAVNAVGGAPATLVGATETLCRAARSARLRRLVHVSSMSVYAPRPGLASEDWPLQASPAPYAAAKIASEAAVRAHAAAGESAVSLRAGVVFGPHSSQWSVRIARLLLAGRLGDLGAAGDGFCNLTHEAIWAPRCVLRCGRARCRRRSTSPAPIRRPGMRSSRRSPARCAPSRCAGSARAA